MTTSTSVEELFDEVAERLLAESAGVTRGRMLRASGLATGGKFFAMIVQGELVVKLPADRVRDLVAEGAGRPFESGRRVLREWVRLRPADERACEVYVAEARGFVVALAKT